MELTKILQDVYEASKHWHFSLVAGLISSFKTHSGVEAKDKISDLGDVPGDNILPSQILISISSRRGLEARF